MDVRVIAAPLGTCCNASARATFARICFYRLHVVPIHPARAVGAHRRNHAARYAKLKRYGLTASEDPNATDESDTPI